MFFYTMIYLFYSSWYEEGSLIFKNACFDWGEPCHDFVDNICSQNLISEERKTKLILTDNTILKKKCSKLS